MAIYVFQTATGELVSSIPGDLTVAQAQAINANNSMAGLAQPDVLAAKGLTAVDSLPPLGPVAGSNPPTVNVWNAATKTVDAVAASPKPKNVTAGQFIMLFTPAEDQAIYASADPQIQQWLRALSVSTTINLNDMVVVQPGLQYLVSQSLLTSVRMAQIIAGTAPGA